MRHLLPLLGIVLAGGALHSSPLLAQRDTTGTPVRDTTPPVVLQAADSAPAASPPSTRDVTRRALDVFGDSLVLAPAPADSSADAPTWDMDVRSYETEARVAHYVAMFTGRSKAAITQSLERGTRYESMIRAKFRAGGLPEDMYYLALVESGYNPNAYSRAAAVGMWQFMTSTGRGMGLRIDWWVDERRDPVRSTGAAVRFIRGLRDQFGSLYLAAAAYNGGPGRVARGLAKYSDDIEHAGQAEDAFFVLAEKDYLHNETREYVPQLIAAALVAKEPVRYGMTLRPLAPLAYDSVKVGGGTPLAAVAKAASTTGATIRELNPHLLRGMTPPGARIQVRIPVGAAAGCDSAMAALPKAERVGTVRVVTKKGETVDRVAEAHGISSAMVESFNPRLRRLKPSGKLVTGQVLMVPTPAVAALALRIPDPSVEKYGSSKSARLRTHTVKRGETLGAIARRFGTTTERVMRLNGLRKPVIFPGQDLIVAGPVARVSSSRSIPVRKGPPLTARERAEKKATAPAPKKKVTAKKATAKKTTAKKATAKTKTGAGSKAGARRTSPKATRK